MVLNFNILLEREIVYAEVGRVDNTKTEKVHKYPLRGPLVKV